MAASAAGTACSCWSSGKFMYAIRTLPLSTYSLRSAANDWSCQLLQYGHSKSLTISIHTLAPSAPRMRPESAAARSARLSAGIVPRIAASAAAVAEAGTASGTVADGVAASADGVADPAARSSPEAPPQAASPASSAEVARTAARVVARRGMEAGGRREGEGRHGR
jgi:hypothetical protein